ncbi:hypothetical protein FBZ84_101120 [Azospirillum baldaniorum]|uniref:hypothetical protein n=1 Tax=Azospirillum baldaniorum TaxID=1064539 RepID=UPI0011A71424|nr:hypothetical protein [Azospirillum baldaniorum]TWA71854.1 hypothetical protein FBZ84_101120 [Azospirillum baldaniorum]
MAEHDLFARAKGPRRLVTCTEVVSCPWCSEDAGEAVAAFEEETECPACGKEFTVKGEGGDLVCVGLLSPADMKYLAAREAQGEGA